VLNYARDVSSWHDMQHSAVSVSAIERNKAVHTYMPIM